MILGIPDGPDRRPFPISCQYPISIRREVRGEDCSGVKHGFSAFACQQSRMARDALLQGPWSAEQQALYEAMASTSLAAQKDIEAADSLPFEAWREQYMAVEELG